MKRKASAVWQGGLKDGKGTISAESGVLSNVPYSFAKRFEDEKGTNPEELIAAAHASCFAMATSAQLGTAGITAQSISATATVALEKVGQDGPAVNPGEHRPRPFFYDASFGKLRRRQQVPECVQDTISKPKRFARAGCARLVNIERGFWRVGEFFG